MPVTKRCKISAQTLKDLGFTEKWPGGNPKEPWWENPAFVDLGFVWFTERPTVGHFWNEITSALREQGRKEVRNMFREAMGERA